MPNVVATQEDPNNPGADDWRPETAKDPSRERADFLAGWGKDPPAKVEKKIARGKPAPVDDSDLDDPDEDPDEDEDEDEEVDLIESAPGKKPKKPVVDDDDDEDEDEDTDDEDEDDEEDPDADLEDEDEDKDKPEKDPKVAQGMAKLQRQEKRMREQIDRERESVRSELAQGRQQLESLQAEIAKAKSKYEGLAERAKLDPLGVLEELGVDDDEFVGKSAHARLQAKTNPAYREAAARMKSERTVRAELDALKAKDAAREREAEESKKATEQKANVDRLIGAIAKEAKSVAKATLTNRLLKSDPDEARGLLVHVTGTLWKRDGMEPSARKVVLEAEKLQRSQLRKYGIDPKTLTAAVEISTDDTDEKPSGKPAKGKAKPGARAPLDKELRRPTKEELLSEDWTSGARAR